MISTLGKTCSRRAAPDITRCQSPARNSWPRVTSTAVHPPQRVWTLGYDMGKPASFVKLAPGHVYAFSVKRVVQVKDQ